MPKNKDFQRRIHLLDECLRRRQKKWSAELLLETINSKLFDEFGKDISIRTLQNDIKYLKDEAMAPLIKEKEGQVYYYSYSDPNYSIKNLPVTDEEVTYLKDALSILRQVQSFSILGDIETIVSKLENTIDTNVPESKAYIHFEHNHTAGNEYIDTIFSAIKEQVVLRLSYQPFGKNEPYEWLIHPYLLKEYRNRWFLIGRKNNEPYATNIALDRVKKIRNSKEQFIRNDIFELNTYYDSIIGVTFPNDAKVERIELKVTPAQVPYVKTKPIHSSQSILKSYKNGGLLISLDLIVNYELKSLLLSYGDSVEVLKPEQLRAEMQSIVTGMMKNYSSSRK